MVIATQHRPRAAARSRQRRVAAALLGSLFAWLLATPAYPQAPPAGPRDGLFLTVPNPITDTAVGEIESKVKTAFERQNRRIRTIVFDFNPNDAPAGTSRPAPCTALAYYLRDLRLGRVANLPEISTVAFVHSEVTRHTVLPVLACGELIMSNKARLGDVLRDQDSLDPSTALAYKVIAQSSTVQDLVLKMVNPDMEVRKVRTRDGVRYLDRKKLDKLIQQKDRGGVLADDGVPPGLEARSLVFDTKLAREFGLCKAIYETRVEVAMALKLPPRSLREDFLAGRTPVAWRIEVRGAINKAKLDSLERRIKGAIGHDANLLILQLDCEGGETVDAATFAQGLRQLKDNSGNLPVKTVAYIPPGRSLGAATFLALGCSEIVMAHDAVLGNFDYLKDQGPDALKAKRDMLVRLAVDQGYPPLLFEAMLDPNLVLYRVHRKTDPGDFHLINEEELNRDARSADPKWVPEGRLSRPAGEFLKLDAAQAREWGVALHSDVDSPDALYGLYQLDPAKVRLARDDWLDKVAEFFREPLVNVFLIMIGIAGLILELKMPGIGLPGVIAAVCFVLFFWAHSFVGQFTMLAVLLFVLGLILIGLEIFVLPGFGVTGISGILLVVASLVLVTLERMPETTQDWVNLGTRLSGFGISLVVAIIGAFVLAWYLPHLPYASRLVLVPPTEDEGTGDEAGGPAPDARAALLGAIGVAATTLRPAGKARFGDDYLDVIAEGDYVNPGSRVQVIEIEGNRIVVKEV
jgi:membrane-bound ClpP family serine protease